MLREMVGLKFIIPRKDEVVSDVGLERWILNSTE